MRRFFSIHKGNMRETAVFIWTSAVILFFSTLTIVVFPAILVTDIPETHTVSGVSGYVSLLGDSDAGGDGVFRLHGEWEFYPGELYSFSDFTSGRAGEYRIADFPHNWKNEPGDVIEKVGYATYRMRVRVPYSFDGIGIYSRYQHSAYEIFLNDIPICSAGVVSEDFNEHVAVYLPTNGYTFFSIGAEGRTLSVIVHVQNAASDMGGLDNDIYIGSSESIKTLRTILLTVNGLISGGLLLLFACFLIIYLSGPERTEYLDYTIVSLVALFISLTNGGESLMYGTGIDSVLLVRIEYCAFVTGSFFANYSVLKRLLTRGFWFNAIHVYVAAANLFFLVSPSTVSSTLKTVVVAVAASLFAIPLFDSIKTVRESPGFNGIVSLMSYAIVSTGVSLYTLRMMPWGSIDVLSIALMLHCILQMLIYLHRYNKTEQTLKEMTETLEERISQRTSELTLMKEKAEAATVSKSNFLATMSHEIRTPMNAIMGMSDLMRTDNLDDIQLKYLTDIKRSSKILLQLINDILDFSKIEAGKFEIIPDHFNLFATYDNICSTCQYSAGVKGLDFRHSFSPDVPHYIYGDEMRCRQVILNVLNNAVKYTRKGYVDFRVERTERLGAPFLMFRVEDSGIGIKDEDMPRLFAAFQQLDSASNRKIVGTGLGLSITQLLVNLMDGEILVESEYGVGSVFTIYLPLVEGDSREIKMPELYVPVTCKDAKVLVVDDNSINLTVAAGFLAVHGIIPDTALSGAEAIEKVQSCQYDIVFMDHMMPEMDGVEATKVIRSLGGDYAGLPIIALTANAISGAVELFKAAGLNDFISKPISAAHLNMILARWLPEDKVTGGALLAESAEICAENNAVLEGLKDITDINLQKGLSHVGGNVSVYLRILSQFCNEYEDIAAGISDYLNLEDWGNYTIKVHAMKGALANLGAMELSEYAYRLECASRDGEYLVCTSQTAAFCDKLGQLRDKLLMSGLMTWGQPPVEKTAISVDELKQNLAVLAGACMQGDSDTAEDVGGMLAASSYSEQVDAELSTICRLIYSFDYEIVAEKANRLLKELD